MENQKRYERKPNYDMHAKLSRDGRYWIITRVETWILPRKYLDVIAFNHGKEKIPDVAVPESGQPQKKGKRNADSHGKGN